MKVASPRVSSGISSSPSNPQVLLHFTVISPFTRADPQPCETRNYLFDSLGEMCHHIHCHHLIICDVRLWSPKTESFSCPLNLNSIVRFIGCTTMRRDLFLFFSTKANYECAICTSRKMRREVSITPSRVNVLNPNISFYTNKTSF